MIDLYVIETSYLVFFFQIKGITKTNLQRNVVGSVKMASTRPVRDQPPVSNVPGGSTVR